jgi:drug/metabolite transporter (DMT)-like permease
MNVIATWMTELGDLPIFITLICSLLLIFLNSKNARSSFKRPVPVQFVFAGWVGFIISYIGMVAITRSGYINGDIGFLYSMSSTVSALLIYLAFSLMLLGTAWTLRSRRLGAKVAQVRGEEALGRSPTFNL